MGFRVWVWGVQELRAYTFVVVRVKGARLRLRVRAYGLRG